MREYHGLQGKTMRGASAKSQFYCAKSPVEQEMKSRNQLALACNRDHCVEILHNIANISVEIVSK
jgi:hypothetical protein